MVSFLYQYVIASVASVINVTYHWFYNVLIVSVTCLRSSYTIIADDFFETRIKNSDVVGWEVFMTTADIL